MAKRVKDKWIGARADNGLIAEITNYIEIAEMTQGELLRAAVLEYMANHPVTPIQPAKVKAEKED